jgi:cytoskeletal protein CcmA (bactofilin family)
MKKQLIAVAIVLTVFGGLAALMPQVSAESKFVGSERGNITLAKDKTHNGSYYAAGQDIVIDGIVKGDVYCAGQSLKVNGTVEGDVICAAQVIEINGTVQQDVRLAGQFITVSGSVGRTLTSFGQDVDLTRTATVGGDLNGAAQVLTIDGTVAKDLAFGSETLKITGVVEGSARLTTDTLELTSKPAIKGNLEYDGENRQEISDKSVAGEVKFNQVAAGDNDEDVAGAILNAFLFLAAAMMATAIIVALVAPRYLERSFGLARRKIGLVILSGLAVNFGTPILALTLMFTGVGIPVALMMFAALFIVNVLAFPFAAYFVARALFGQVIHNVVLLIVAGAALLTIAFAIPLLNLLVYLAVVTVGVGSIVVTITNGYRKPHYSIAPVEKRKK